MPFERKELIKKRGYVIDITYTGVNGEQCFAIGWFFQMTEDLARLKVTSTAGDSYECLDIPIKEITEVKAFFAS